VTTGPLGPSDWRAQPRSKRRTGQLNAPRGIGGKIAVVRAGGLRYAERAITTSFVTSRTDYKQVTWWSRVCSESVYSQDPSAVEAFAMPDDRAARTPRVIVNTGNGKGKTTAALGLLFRAAGRGWKVVMLQFIKAETSNYGEHRAARKMGIEIIPLGAGFTWLSENIEKDRALAQRCWALCKEKLLSGEYDLVALDEFTYPLSFGWLDLEDVLQTLRERPRHVHVVITGRNAPQPLIDYADTVTEMTVVKHAYKSGVKAQAGIEF
jgi:cob(I)alamin adenosyltransferase